MNFFCVDETIEVEIHLNTWEEEAEDMQTPTRHIIKVDQDIGTRFKSICALERTTMKAEVERLILLWIAEHTPPTEPADRQTGIDSDPTIPLDLGR